MRRSILRALKTQEEVAMKNGRAWIPALVTLVVALAGGTARADDVRGADRILCTAVEATRCVMGGDCEMGAPWNWNIPQFIEVDLNAKTLATTKASGEQRTTPIKNLEKIGGHVYLQGIQGGRAFSFTIEEESGDLAAAVASDGVTVSAFGACTPMNR
jgi:hypothetical protein